MHPSSPHPVAPQTAEACRLAEAFLERWIGLDSQTVGSGAIARAVRMRMNACGEPDEGAFLARISRDAEERERFIDEVVVPESWFFRDCQVFDYLRQQAPAFAQRAYPAPLRVLCVPCAAGEEPYSVAIAFLEAGLSPDQFRIDATDVSRASLRRAAAATYSANAFRAADASFRDRWFRDRDAAAELDEAVRRQVHFSWGNLLDQSFAADREPYDIIFCRNLLIYLTADARSRAEQTVDRLLAPEGILVLGAAEPPILKRPWRPVTSNAVFTLRRGTATTDRLPPTLPLPPSPPAASAGAGVRPSSVPPPPRSPDRPPADGAVESHTLAVDDVLREAGSLANAGRHAEALALCSRCQQTAGPSARVFFLMGMLHQAVGELERAEACLHKTLYLDANHDEAFLSLAIIASQRGEDRMAEHYRRSAARVLARKGAS
jgi:chemotaxis protein methyltransferase WspC